MNMKVIDIHTHIYPDAISAKATKALGEFYDFIVEGGGTYADIEREAESTKGQKYEMAGFLFLAVATSAHQVPKVNDFVAHEAALSRSHGYFTKAFGGMHQDIEDFEGEIARCESMGLHGIKIHPDIQRFDLLDERMYRLCEVMEGRMTLFLHIGDYREEYQYSNPKKLAKLMDAFPRLEVVAAHFGGYTCWDGQSDCLFGRDNIYFDLSSALWAMTPEKARELIDKCGRDRVMYGSDYPVKTLHNYLDLFDRLGLDDSLAEDILYNNAMRFLADK